MFVVLIAATSLATYTLTFSDDFKTLKNWVPQYQPGSASGNNGWQHYTPRQQNVEATPNGLILRAQKQQYADYNYTSGKVISKDTFGPYGFINIKVGVPKGEALWPAIYLLPPNGHSIYGDWPACGSINIMDTVCKVGGVFSNLSFGGKYVTQHPYKSESQWTYVEWNKVNWFGVEWQPDFIRFWQDGQVLRDGSVYGTLLQSISSTDWFSKKPNGSLYSGNSPFNQPINIVISLAVGGDLPCSEGCCGKPDLPNYMQIFQVDVYEMSSLDIE